MKKDPTEFRKRFAAWKNGEKPYDSGLPKYENGKDQFEDTIDFLRRHEGFKDTTYLDGNGIPTIGYGFTDSQLVKKGKINRNDADIRLRKEVEDRELFLSRIKNWDKLSEASKTALRSYYYNYPAGFKDTTKFMKAWNSGNYEEAIRQVDAGMNDPANPGLRRRRMLEQLLLMSDPFLTTKRSKFVKQLEDSPAYTGQFKYIKPIQTDYSLTNRSGGKLNAWKGAGSPSYGGVDVRIPSVEEYVRSGTFIPRYKNGKCSLPKYSTGTDGELDMGNKMQLTPIQTAKIAKSTIHEQPVSNADPIGQFVIESVGATKGAKILGDILAAKRIDRMKEVYKRIRSFDNDIQNYTGKSLRRENIKMADKAARESFTLSRPDNPLYWIFDPIVSGYTKIQSHPVLGPLIPF